MEGQIWFQDNNIDRKLRVNLNSYYDDLELEEEQYLNGYLSGNELYERPTPSLDIYQERQAGLVGLLAGNAPVKILFKLNFLIALKVCYIGPFL